MNSEWKRRVSFYTLGCKVNKYDTEAVSKIFTDAGYEVVPFEEYADVYVINTCTVTNLSDKKSRQLIRKVKKINDKSIVVAMGCYAQVAPEEVKEIDGVNIVIGTKNRLNILNYIETYKNENIQMCVVSDVLKEKEFEKLNIEKIDSMTRAYLKVQDGCNQFCSYCIIPYARGGIRSREINDVLEEAKTLAKNGFKEIVLTGIHVASYGKDLENIMLIDLIEKVHEVDGIERIRLSSIEPNIFNEDFLKRYFSLSKTCNSFHISLQSGCDKTLKDMNRKYTTAEYESAINKIREFDKNCAITTDIIVGFPGETSEDFNNTCEFVKKIKFSKSHIFPYSRKKGTKAYNLKNQIENKIKNERAKILRDTTDITEKAFNDNLKNTFVEILIEKETDNYFEGHTKNYVLAKIEKNAGLEVNDIIKVRVKNTFKDYILCSENK